MEIDEIKRIQTELPVPKVESPKVTEYEAEILVIGSGFAGIAAAMEAKKSNKSVVIVDKGSLGYSGCSPWAQSYQFFNEEYGDDAQMQIDYTAKAGEYIANLDWYKIYIEESKDAYQDLKDWRIINPFPLASECEPNYYEKGMEVEYHERFAKYDRRQAWRRLVNENDITVVNKTMITNVLTKDGRVAGAMGFHVPSGTIITFYTPVVILATGSGVYKNSGYPISGCTFDGEYICYNLGLPIVGREFEKPQGANSIAPCACWNTYSWGYLECLHATAGMSQFGADPNEKLLKSIRDVGLVGKLPALEKGIKPLKSHKEPGFSPKGNAVESFCPEEDDRVIGNTNDKMPKRDVFGAAIGAHPFKSSGVFCGIDDFDGFTGIPGLYVAGDIYGCMMYGAQYSPGQGGSLPVSQIQGKRSAKAAVNYLSGLVWQHADQDLIEKTAEEILMPMKRETGMNPRWAKDVLHATMAPFWISLAKSEETLNAALVYVEQLRDKVMPILIARDSHDLRLVHEFRAQICDAEMKIRSSLARKESRGSHYRIDYPYRDDENFLVYIVVKKAEDGGMVVEKVPVKDEWKGDITQEYDKRYPIHFPKEGK